MDDMVEQVRREFELLRGVMDERVERLWAAAKAIVLGTGGIEVVTKATGIRSKRICQGKKELKQLQGGRVPHEQQAGARRRIRRPGAGRKRLTDKDPTLLPDLEKLVDSTTRGDPMSPLRWTSKSVRKLTVALNAMGHRVGRQKVCELLHKLKFSLQSTRKTHEGGHHPDRDAQFQHINATAALFLEKGLPVISVDAKKKELVGNFKNHGREWQPKGQPERVNVYDFVDEGGKATPYGVYDIFRNEGWVNVGITADTSEFAVQSIRDWWNRMGKLAYPDAGELMITADGGGSNGYRVRLWKLELQKLADETGLHIVVCHYPPGTSKWNKIEHRMFSHITENWRGRPLRTLETVVALIGNTTTTKGLRINAEIDTRAYEKGKKVTDQQLRSLALDRLDFHGEWNYVIHPRGCSCTQ